MELSLSIQNYIKSKEGLELQAYYDLELPNSPNRFKGGKGVITIGYGHTGNVNGKPIFEGQVIDQAMAEALFTLDKKYKAEDVINQLMDRDDIDLNQNQFDALGSFEYNTGALSESETLWSMIKNKSNPQDIANWWAKHYTTSGGVLLEGLITRRQFESQLFITPIQ